MNTTQESKAQTDSEQEAWAQLSSICEMVAKLTQDDDDLTHEAIQEHPLSVEVRTPWYTPGDSEGLRPSEFCILLCTGGPAVRIIGEFDEHLQPDRAWIEHQDWGTSWQQIFGLDPDQQAALLTYCQQFYFGE